jgi:hypothetical protein
MMDLIIETVKKLETMMKNSGCEDGGVVLDVNADVKTCQFEKGACMTAAFGGRSADFVTFDPVRAKTKISFMFGAPLETSGMRGAATAIVNVVTGFFCLSRVLHSCPASSHAECNRNLMLELSGKRVFCIGAIPFPDTVFRNSIVTNQQDAEVILINAEGIIEAATGGIIQAAPETTRVICLGPSTAGVARLSQLEHWCPFGTC